MREDWKVQTLGDVCKFQRGLVYSKEDEVENSNNGVLRANNIDVSTNTLSLNDIRYVSDAVNIPEARKVKSGSIIICTASGSKTHLGKVAFIDDDYGYAFGGFMGQLTPKPHIDARFLYYVMISTEYKSFIEKLSNGMNINNLKFSDLQLFSLPVPPISEQRRIVSILDEAFEGIRSAATNTQKNIANVRELFDTYLRSALSRRGSGWDEKTLREVSAKFGRGKSKHRPRGDVKLLGGQYPLIQTGDVANSNHRIVDFSQTYNEFGLAQSMLWPKGTVCIAIVGANVAETAILDFDACFPDSVIGIVVDEKLADNEYVEFLLQTFKSLLKQRGKGTARDNINLATFESLKFPFPNVAMQREIVARVNEIAEHTRGLESLYQKKLDSLAELKQSILLKALVGELTAQPQRFLREAVA